MLNKTFAAGGACFCLLASGLAYASGDDALAQGHAYPLKNYIRSVLTEHPSLLAADAELTAAIHNQDGAAKPLYNPELVLDGERTDLTTSSIGLSQAVDWHGKRSANAAWAELETLKARVSHEKKREQLIAQLIRAVSNLQMAEQISDLQKKRLESIQQFSSLAGKRFAAGDISRAEKQLAELAAAEASMAYASAESERFAALAEIRGLTGKTPHQALAFPSLPVLKKIDLDTLLSHHPDVKLTRAIADAARAAVLATDKQRLSDPVVGLRVGKEGDEKLLGLSLSIPLHIRNRFDSQVKVAESEALKAEMEARSLLRQTRENLSAAIESYRIQVNAWRSWQSHGVKNIQSYLNLINRLWRAGESTTAEYLVQLQQGLSTAISGAKLKNTSRLAWIHWLETSGQVSDWLNEGVTQ